jgi:hypothetical protein
MFHQVPLAIDGKGDPDLPAQVLAVDRPAALELYLDQLPTVPVQEDEIYATIIDGKYTS